jgi:hypothetical protein
MVMFGAALLFSTLEVQAQRTSSSRSGAQELLKVIAEVALVILVLLLKQGHRIEVVQRMNLL